MRVVLQCAAGKQPNAGTLRTRDGKPVHFRAHPEHLPPGPDVHYAHPDGPSDQGGTWRDVLAHYNRDPGGNPLGLLRAADLYKHPVYRGLDRSPRITDLMILSAGWGLLSADWLTPDYDITFSPSAGPEKRRMKRDRFDDWAQVDLSGQEPLVFLGGTAYFDLFVQLTAGYTGRRVAIYNSTTVPSAPGVEAVRFETSARTNWHYGAAKALLEGWSPC